MEQLPSRAFAYKVVDRVCIAQYIDKFRSTHKFRCFQPQTVLQYDAFCDDFGPMDLSCITRFIQMLDHELQAYPACRIVYCVENGRRELTNAVFLLGSYLILRHGRTLEDTFSRFQWLGSDKIEDYRDATYSQATFRLTVKDCWRGLARGMQLEWIRHSTTCRDWGKINIDEYTHLDSPLNADLHSVIPDKLIAFRGPKDMDRESSADDRGPNLRLLSPHHYAELFRRMGVSAVVRLNAPEYDRDTFVAAGIAHHDLPFDDCTAPPAAVVRRFFAIVDAAPGAVAVHCSAGLGRTGTLIALYLMRSCGFGARGAMGWLRIVRPGSVIGEQQRYLCRVEAVGIDGVSMAEGRVGPAAAATHVLASQVASGVPHRRAALLRRKRPDPAGRPAGPDLPGIASADVQSPETEAREHTKDMHKSQGD
jgi:cell division cycle 14